MKTYNNKIGNLSVIFNNIINDICLDIITSRFIWSTDYYNMIINNSYILLITGNILFLHKFSEYQFIMKLHHDRVMGHFGGSELMTTVQLNMELLNFLCVKLIMCICKRNMQINPFTVQFFFSSETQKVYIKTS